MKTDKSIKIPMIAGMIIQGLAVVISLICIIMQSSFYPRQINITQKIIPVEFMLQCVILLMYFIFFLVMHTNEGSSRRTVGVIMLIVYAIIRISFPYVSMISNLITVRRGADYIAASSTLSSYTNLIVSPFVVIAAILTVTAVARYGISEDSSPQNMADQNMFNA